MKLTQPLKWHGGKHYLAKQLVEMMPTHVHYVEPFAGGLSVLLEKNPDGVSEVVNDIDNRLTNFWRVLQDEQSFSRFVRQVEAVPFSELEWTDSADCVPKCDRDVQAAVRFFVRCRQSRAGTFDSFAPLSRNRTRRRMNEQASAWMTAVEGLPAVANRLKRVAILCDDALFVVGQQDGPNTLFYCDPPYVHETRHNGATAVYAHEMTEADHGALADVLRACTGKVMLSGYPSDLYGELYADWRMERFDLPNNSAGGKSKRRMQEVVWMNW